MKLKAMESNGCFAVFIFLDHSIASRAFSFFLKISSPEFCGILCPWFFLVFLQPFHLHRVLSSSDSPPNKDVPQVSIFDHLVQSFPTRVSGIGILGVPRILILSDLGDGQACLFQPNTCCFYVCHPVTLSLKYSPRDFILFPGFITINSMMALTLCIQSEPMEEA